MADTPSPGVDGFRGLVADYPYSPLLSTTDQRPQSDNSSLPLATSVTEILESTVNINSVSSISSSVFPATSSSSITSTSSRSITSTSSLSIISPSSPSIISASSPSITSTPSPSITSTLITTTSTVPPVRKLSEGGQAGLAVGVAIVSLLVGIALLCIFRRQQTHRKHAAYNSRISEGPNPSFSQPEVTERSHELDGEEVLELDGEEVLELDGEEVLELDGSMLHSPAEIDGAEAAIASTKTNIQTWTIASKSGQESHPLPEAINENRGTQTRNSAGKQAPSARETKPKPKPRTRTDELNRLEEEERRIRNMIADAEGLERMRKEYSAIQDRIRQVKEGFTASVVTLPRAAFQSRSRGSNGAERVNQIGGMEAMEWQLV